jgi:hypothetical protein
MKKTYLVIAGLAIAGTMLASTPAVAAPLEKGHFHDVFTNDPFTCETTGTPVQEHDDISGNFLFNLRGSSAFPYFRESEHGTVVFTNLDNGGTYTEAFSSNYADVKIVDNGDGTITIFSQVAGGSRWYDTNGKLVLKDPGQFRFSIQVDYNGTPGDASDDVEIPGSFQAIRTTGLDIVDRDFCADLVEFTQP